MGALTLGDNVDTASDTTQWTRDVAFFDALDDCNMPYSPTYGNHDGTPTVQDYTTVQDATNYHLNIGRDRLDSRWWIRERSDVMVSIYGTDRTPRSHVADFGPLVIVSAEWGGLRNPAAAANAFTPVNTWMQRMMQKYADRMVFITSHEYGCLNTNCSLGLTNMDEAVSSAYPNWVGGASGHWNAGNCAAGFGFHGAATTAGGRPVIMGGMDHSCSTRAYNATTPYGWNGILTWKRLTRQLCIRSIRVIDASTTPATLLSSPDYDRSSNLNNAEACATITPWN